MESRDGDMEVTPSWEVGQQGRMRGQSGTGCSARGQGHIVPNLGTPLCSLRNSSGQALVMLESPRAGGGLSQEASSTGHCADPTDMDLTLVHAAAGTLLGRLLSAGKYFGLLQKGFAAAGRR